MNMKDCMHEQAENIAYYEQLATHYSLFISDPVADAEREVDWLYGVLAGREIRSLLDAGCGTGRHAVPLALHGMQVTAADPCGAMLREARARANAVGASICFVQARFDQLPDVLHRSYDAVILLGNSLCNLPSLDAVQTALRGVRGICTSNTPVIIGIKDFESISRDRPRFRGHRLAVVNGVQTILFEVWRYKDPQLISTTIALSRKPNTKRWTSQSASTREYMLLPREMAFVSKEAGFRLKQRLPHPNEARFLLLPA